ncbi:MAG: hypothetical protein ACTHMY_09765 [Solirubrobacteraceae bacterium]
MAEPKPANQSWFAVRCVIHHRDRGAYEERITLWQARDFDQAIMRAEQEARDYAADLQPAEYTGLAQAYQLFDPLADGAEVFSLFRDSPLPVNEYLTGFFDTGSERQRTD